MQRTHRQRESRTAVNIRLNEIIYLRALFGNQSVVHLTNSIVYSNSGASNPLKKLLL